METVYNPGKIIYLPIKLFSYGYNIMKPRADERITKKNEMYNTRMRKTTDNYIIIILTYYFIIYNM